MRNLAIALVAVFLVAAGTFAPAAAPGARADTAVAPKVAIIVGPVESSTSSYRSYADAVASAALAYTPNVVKVYSPNATWAAVQAAVNGASIVVYLGHGNGWPSPYPNDPAYTQKDGFGLNTGTPSDYTHIYYGEPSVSTLKYAPNAIVLLNHLCYASGNSEPQNADPTLAVAEQRVDNYAAGFLKGGARAVIAEGHGSLAPLITALFTTHQTVYDAWQAMPNAHGNTFSFASTRTPGMTASMDPDSPTGGYYRSFTGSLDLRTDDVTGASMTSTSEAPATLQVPGAATAPAGAALYATSSLSGTPTTSLSADTPVRVEQGPDIASDASPDPVLVKAIDGAATGWTDGNQLVPQDSTPPQLWSLDGPLTFSPNGNGQGDTLTLRATFTEEVAWSFKVTNTAGAVLATGSGDGNVAILSWDGKSAGAVVPDGSYQLKITATDPWGNGPLEVTRTVVVDTSIQLRLAGTDRYATAAAVSKAYVSPGVGTVFVATGANFPDALAGAAAAGAMGAPILLVAQGSVPTATATELTRLHPAKIVILGSTGVVSAAVASALGQYAASVTRLAGTDRYATAAAVSKAYVSPGVGTVFVATGANFPDALAGAAAAGAMGAPILLVAQGSVPTATATELTRLHPAKIVILGSTGVVSAAVASALGQYAASVTRLAGTDRYATAAAVSKAYVSPGVGTVFVATGANFPDALAGAAAAGAMGAPILLVAQGSVPTATATEIARLASRTIVILGGPSVVSDAVRTQLAALQPR